MPITYDTPLWRPPSEAESLILQATIGCSYNRCSFCSMYRTKSFRARPLADVLGDIDRVARAMPDVRRIFLADGDALVLPVPHLEAILDHAAARFPHLARVSCYAMPVNLIEKSTEDLSRLREKKLGILYYGIESGAAGIQRRITKGATPKVMVEGLLKARAAGLKVSATVVLGLGGKRHWQEHVDGTLDLLARAPLNFLSTLILGLDESIALEFRRKFGDDFEPQDDFGTLDELERLIQDLAPPRPLIFRSNHASNALALAGNLPKDRGLLLATIAAARARLIPLRPRWVRGY